MRELRIWAEMFDDAQKARIACQNRAVRGGVDAETYKPQLDALKAAEKEIGKAMRKCYRRLAPPGVLAWQKATMPYGEHLVARLLGVVGDPCNATPHHWEGEGDKRVLVADEPYERTVSQLLAYCGHGDPTRKRRVGMTADEAFALGNPRAKMLTRLLAESRMKARCDRYRPVYDEARMDWAERDTSDGHKHSHALRLVGKAILQDLWREARAGAEPETNGRAPVSVPEAVAA